MMGAVFAQGAQWIRADFHLHTRADRDFFLVYAHVEAPSGLCGRLSELGQNEFFRRRTLAFQKVRTHDGAGKDKPCRTKIQSWYPAELEGSNPKCIDEIGRGKTSCQKLGELSFEAVKFALSDPAARVWAWPQIELIDDRAGNLFKVIVAQPQEQHA